MNRHMSILVTVGGAMTLVIALLLLVAPTAGEQVQALLASEVRIAAPRCHHSAGRLSTRSQLALLCPDRDLCLP